MIGQTISHYRIVSKLGEGGMGVVYRAEDLDLQRPVALKFLNADSSEDDEARQRFLREARAAASLDHPNVCTIYEIGEADGKIFLAMALIEGQTVQQKIARRPLPLDEALDIATQAAEGLNAAHAKGIVHRDIKSANLMVTPDGAVKVMDFGLAQLSGQAGITKSRTTLGTTAYISPEQAQNQPVDRRSDLWSLGVVLYEMVTGSPPFMGEHEAAVLYAIVHSTPEPVTARRAGLPEALDRVLSKALAKDPKQRYQHAADLLVDLRAIRKGLPVTAPRRSYRREILMASAIGLGAAAAGITLQRQKSGPRVSSMVVLPLENLSGDSEQEYFADGMTDALTTDLSKIGSLRMISRQTAMRYKRSPKPLKEIAQELNVDAVVGGAVAREAGRVRVTAQLIDAATGQNIWAESYERELASVLAMQSEVAKAIAGKVRIALRPDEETLLSKARKVNPQTYEAYLKGQFWLSKGTPEAFDKAIAFFQQAVETDPADPLAYAGMAIGYVTAGHLSDTPDHSVPRARAAATRALQLDDTQADAHLAIAILDGYRDWKWDACGNGIRKALALNPNHGFAHFQLGWFHALYKRWDDAIAEGRRARELDPLSVPYLWTADFYRTARRFDEAIADTKRALEVDPKLSIPRLVLASTYTDMGRHDEAIAEYKIAVEHAPPMIGYLGIGYLRGGRMEEGKQILKILEAQKLTGWTAHWRASFYALLGNADAALQMIDFEPHHDWLAAIATLDEFKPLHKDPRFVAALKKRNLPPV